MMMQIHDYAAVFSFDDGSPFGGYAKSSRRAQPVGKEDLQERRKPYFPTLPFFTRVFAPIRRRWFEQDFVAPDATG